MFTGPKQVTTLSHAAWHAELQLRRPGHAPTCTPPSCSLPAPWLALCSRRSHVRDAGASGLHCDSPLRAPATCADPACAPATPPGGLRPGRGCTARRELLLPPRPHPTPCASLALPRSLSPAPAPAPRPSPLLSVCPSVHPPPAPPPPVHTLTLHAAFVQHAAGCMPGAHLGQRTRRWRDWLRALCGRTRRRTLGAMAVAVVAAAFSLQPGWIVTAWTLAVVPMAGAGARLSRSVLSL